MSTEHPLTLADYVNALVNSLHLDDQQAFARMREIVGARAARIELDNEAVEVIFVAEQLRVEARLGFAVDGTGSTDSATVLDLLDGNLEVSTAVLEGRLRLTGDAEDVARMCVAIEILLSASIRSPQMQALAARFRTQHPSVRRKHNDIAWYPFASSATEIDLLQRLDLLPGKGKP